MERIDALDEHVVMTSAGSVLVSTACHDDGSLSVVAWLLPTGRRVGLVRGRVRPPTVVEALIDASLADSDVAEHLQRHLDHLLDGQLQAAERTDRLLKVRPELRGWPAVVVELSLAVKAPAPAEPAHPAPRPQWLLDGSMVSDSALLEQ